MSKLKRSLILLLVPVIALIASACNPNDPAQLRAWFDLNPDVGSEVTPETMNDAQRAVVSHLQEKQAAEVAYMKSVANRGGSNHPFLVCVRNHESATSGLYSAQNPRSSASGAYQYLRSTWINVSARAGYPGYPTAASAPPSVQDTVALWHYRNLGPSAWAGSGCR